MKERLRRFFSTGFLPQPVGRWQWLALRLLFAAVVIESFRDHQPFSYESNPAPVGIARLLPKDQLARWFFDPEPVSHTAVRRQLEAWPEAFSLLREPAFSVLKLQRKHRWVLGAAAVLLVGYLIGGTLLPALSLTGLALLHLAVRTHANSQGWTSHGLQIVTVCLLAQALVAWWWWARERRSRRSGEALPEAGSAGLALYYTQGAVGMLYAISVITKLANSKLMWLYNSRHIGIEVVKTHKQNYLARLETQFEGVPRWAEWMADNPNLTSVMLGGGFFAEAAALLALKDRLWALLLGVSLIAMHRMIFLIMGLQFRYNELLLLVFFVLPGLWYLGSRLAGRAAGRLSLDPAKA